MTKQLKIACLPVAGIQNPYQILMMEGLNESNRLVAFNGINNRFWGILLTAIKQKPDYIHFDWIVSYYYRRFLTLTILSIPLFFLQILFVRYILQIKIVWSFHNILPHDLPFPKIHFCSQKFLIKHCYLVRVFSETCKSIISEKYGYPKHKIKIIPEGSFDTYYPNDITKQQARNDLGIPENSSVLLYFGLIKPYKGIIELIEVFNKIKASKCYLVIAGKVMDPEYGKKIEHLCNESILIFDEFIPKNEVQTYFQAGDIVVLPFKKIENSGSVILAMGFSKPIVTLRSGAVEDRLKHSQSALLFDSLTELHQIVTYVMDLSILELENIGFNNRKALKKYQWTDFQNIFL